MEVHRIKTRQGTLGAIVVGIAEVLEDLARIKWGKLAGRLFTNHKKVDLLEAELKAPGREIAYVIKAKESYGHFDSRRR